MNNRQRAKLRKAIGFIRTVPPEGFDLSRSSWDFIGWMAEVFPDELSIGAGYRMYLSSDPDEPASTEEVGASLFGLSEYTAFGLFGTGTQHAAHPSLPRCYSHTTPEEYAAMLERFLEIDESGAVLHVLN